MTIVRRERRVWAATQTLNDLCELTAMWLCGDLRSQPGYYGPCDVDDADGLLDALIRLNLAGFLTGGSQKGFDGECDGAHWEQWASVTGYATPDVADRLDKALAGTRFQMDAHPAKRPWLAKAAGGFVVTWRDNWTFTTFGRQLSGREIRFNYEGCGRAAVEAVERALCVVIFDPTEGANDLWPYLCDVLGEA